VGRAAEDYCVKAKGLTGVKEGKKEQVNVKKKRVGK